MRKLETFLFLSVRTSAVFLPLVVIAGILAGGSYAYAGFAVVFGFYFLVELILWASGLGVNTDATNEFDMVHPERPGLLEKYGVEAYGILHIIAVPLGVALLMLAPHSPAALVGGILSLGVMAGSVGGLAGHEFIHRRAKHERALGIAVYGAVGYAHFAVSHLYGHHSKVGLPEDWSTSRKGESSFHFLGRAFLLGYFAAWRLETNRRRKRSLRGPQLWLGHYMVHVSLAMAALAITVFLALGAKGLAIYAAVSFLAFTLMEMVNYLSHYGLSRAKNARGQLEPIQNKHSWESNNKVTNWFIFNAGKHCHHHRDPFATHDQLQLANEKEYIPFGLPLMTLIAFVPPLYFHLMDKRLERI